MIRSFFASLLIIALAAGCGYNWWQAYQLRGQVAQLQVEVTRLKKQESRRVASHHGQAKEAPGETEDDAAAEGWLALANEHADKAKAAFDRHDFGIAQTEVEAAVADVRRGAAEPVQATESTISEVHQKLAQLEGLNGVKGGAGQ